MRADLERLEEVMASTRPQGDAPFGVALMRSGLQSVHKDLSQQIEVASRPHLEVHLDGRAVVDHEIRISALAKLLSSLQESISAVAQALTGKATSRSSIPGPLRDMTALWLATVQPGSFGATLRAPAPESEQMFELDEVPTLLDNAVEQVMEVVDLAEATEADDDPIINAVLPLGSRAFKHLSDLASAIVDEDLTANLSWHRPAAPPRTTNLSGHAARRMTEVLGRNKVSESQEIIEGRLGGVSDIRNSVELEQVSGAVIRATVVEELVPELGQYYTRRVEATFDVTTIRSLVTGMERKNYSLVELASVQGA